MSKSRASQFSPQRDEDLDLSRRRYKEYIRLTKDRLDNLDFEDALAQLPVDGGSVLPCGCTKIDHVLAEKCLHRKGVKGH